MSYLNEVHTGQIYEVNNSHYKVVQIRATNVVSENDYIIAVSFKNDNDYFDTKIQNVIKGDEYKLIS